MWWATLSFIKSYLETRNYSVSVIHQYIFISSIENNVAIWHLEMSISVK